MSLSLGVFGVEDINDLNEREEPPIQLIDEFLQDKVVFLPPKSNARRLLTEVVE